MIGIGYEAVAGLTKLWKHIATDWQAGEQLAVIMVLALLVALLVVLCISMRIMHPATERIFQRILPKED
jgi:uncharacterized membrane protein YccC